MLSVTWSQVSGPAPVGFANSNAPATTATFPAAGIYVLRLEADDGALSAADELTLTVSPPDNQPPSVSLISPLSWSTVAAPTSVLLEATAMDPDGAVARVEFYAGHLKLGEATTPPYQFNWYVSLPGVYYLLAKAVDDQGGVADSGVVCLYATGGAEIADLMGHWPFSEPAGTNAFDATPNASHGALLNGVRRTTPAGMPGAIELDGVDDLVRLPMSPALGLADEQFTVALLVRTTNAPAQMLVERENTTWNGEFLFALNRDNEHAGGFSVWNGSQWIDSLGRDVPDGRWHHLAVSYDGSSFRLYTDGVLDRTVSAPELYTADAHPWNFGRFVVGNVGWPFLGQMDEVRVFHRALSGAEIGTLASQTPLNLPPQAFNLSVQTESDQVLSLNLNGTDPDDDPLQYTLLTLPTNGLLSSFNPGTGAFIYQPAHGFTGMDRFTFRAHDGTLESAPAALTLTIAPQQDADADGLPDNWEAAHALNNPDGDEDGDGLTNGQEHLANTDPRNANSCLCGPQIEMTPEGYCRVTWDSVGGVRYRIHFSNGDSAGRFNGFFSPVVRPVSAEMDPAPPGTPSTQSFTDDYTQTGGPPPAQRRYYRVEAVR
jgi:hypothetical protein